jgi:hypothetical protein
VSAVNVETKVGTMDQFKMNKTIAYMILAVGLVSTAASAFVSSFVLAFIGLALTFWGSRLKNAALTVGALFPITVAIRIIAIIYSS